MSLKEFAINKGLDEVTAIDIILTFNTEKDKKNVLDALKAKGVKIEDVPETVLAKKFRPKGGAVIVRKKDMIKAVDVIKKLGGFGKGKSGANILTLDVESVTLDESRFGVFSPMAFIGASKVGDTLLNLTGKFTEKKESFLGRKVTKYVFESRNDSVSPNDFRLLDKLMKQFDGTEDTNPVAKAKGGKMGFLITVMDKK